MSDLFPEDLMNILRCQVVAAIVIFALVAMAVGAAIGVWLYVTLS